MTEQKVDVTARPGADVDAVFALTAAADFADREVAAARWLAAGNHRFTGVDRHRGELARRTGDCRSRRISTMAGPS
ncbi:MAG: hypothetical protein JWP76_5096 [Dactylosporangium sp.]|jgi:hypothetical protein|nr:hypothetical protein [Dactylosporangium sp.]